jgi:VanZ family protein
MARRSAWFWIHAWWPVAAGICVIMLESTAYLGSDHTSGPLRWVWEHIFGPVTNARWEVLHHYVRKSGHFVGYGMLGLLWLRSWWISMPRASFGLKAVLTVLGTGLVASADEFHQFFLPNRTGIPSDVLLDCSGAVALLLLFYLLRGLRRRRAVSAA